MQMKIILVTSIVLSLPRLVSLMAFSPLLPIAVLSSDMLCRSCQSAVARIFGVTSVSLRSAKRCSSRIAFARQTAMYLANIVFGLGYAQIGAAFGRDRTTVRHACAKIEDARDAAIFDQSLAVLETALLQHARFCAGLLAASAEPCTSPEQGGA